MSEEHEKLQIQAANMDQALRSYYSRTHADPIVTDMPFDDLLSAESDGLDGEPGEYEMAQRRAAIRAFFRYLLAEGHHPLRVMKRLYAAGRGLCIEHFAELTMTEAGQMFSETKAAHSWRMRFLSGMVKRSGATGCRLSGQKKAGSVPAYQAAAEGNANRKKSRRRKSKHN